MFLLIIHLSSSTILEFKFQYEKRILKASGKYQKSQLHTIQLGYERSLFLEAIVLACLASQPVAVKNCQGRCDGHRLGCDGKYGGRR